VKPGKVEEEEEELQILCKCLELLIEQRQVLKTLLDHQQQATLSILNELRDAVKQLRHQNEGRR
jgi:hypothetical protein